LRRVCRSCFFFQAEDGIRDRNVTGVQTCALPISVSRLDVAGRSTDETGDRVLLTVFAHIDPDQSLLIVEEEVRERFRQLRLAHKIGRASCRERVSSSEWAGAVDAKRETGGRRSER